MPLPIPQRTADEAATRELDLYAENTGELYRQKQAILANIQRKRKRGVYRHDLAPQLWMYWVDAAAKRYAKEFGGKWFVLFDVPTRRQLAQELADRYKTGEE